MFSAKLTIWKQLATTFQYLGTAPSHHRDGFFITYSRLQLRIFPGERKPFPFHFAVRVSRADSQLTWTYTCRWWEWSMVIILPQGGQLQNDLKLDFGELENHLWAHVESKSSKKKIAGQHTCTDGQELDSLFHRQRSPSRFHPPFYILVCCSCYFLFFRLILKDSPAGKFIPDRRDLLLRQRRHVLHVGLKSSFFDTFGYKPKWIKKDL